MLTSGRMLMISVMVTLLALLGVDNGAECSHTILHFDMLLAIPPQPQLLMAIAVLA